MEEKSLLESIKNCQTAENVINEMQNILGEALSMYDHRKLAWCQHYVDHMRNIELDKFESISAYILEFIEQYTKLTAEEIAKLKDNTKARGKGVMTLREKILLLEKTKDLQFSLWGNVQGKSVMHKKIEFGNYECAMPMNKTTMTIIFRCLWTSYDYCSANLI